MAVTLNENEKKALNELFTSIQTKKSFSDKIKNFLKFFKIFTKSNKVPAN